MADSVRDGLFETLKKIENDFCDLVNECVEKAMQSNPEFCHMYNADADYFRRGVEMIQNYYETEDMLKLVEDCRTNGFIEELFEFKEFVSPNDTAAYKLILSVVEEAQLAEMGPSPLFRYV